MKIADAQMQAGFDAIQQNELVQKQIAIKDLQSRIGDQRSREEKLRETCEGFESIFIQKIWEQMRQTVPKNGYLQSKEGEMYQSLFDVEFAKKMSSAGGIGLADMLYQQLSQQMTDSARRTTPDFSKIAKTETNKTDLKEAKDIDPSLVSEKKATASLDLQSLYTEIEDSVLAENPEELLPEVLASNSASSSLDQSIVSSDSALHKGVNNAESAVAESPRIEAAIEQLRKQLVEKEVQNEQAVAPQAFFSSGPVEKKTIVEGSALNIQANSEIPQKVVQNKLGEASEFKKAQQLPKGLLPQGALWPHSGEILQHFGWSEDPLMGKKVWNGGIAINANAGDPVHAILPGKVVYIGPRELFGNTVVLEHEQGFTSYYGNVEAPHLTVGDKVNTGMNFAKVLASEVKPGEAVKNSFLFEIKRGEMALNPELALGKKMTQVSLNEK